MVDPVPQSPQGFLAVLVGMLPVIWDLTGWVLERWEVFGEKSIRRYLIRDTRPALHKVFGSSSLDKTLLEDIGSYFRFADIVNSITRSHILLLVSLWFSVIEFQDRLVPLPDWHSLELGLTALSLVVFWVLLRVRFYLPSDGCLLCLPRWWTYSLFMVVIASEVFERWGSGAIARLG